METDKKKVRNLISENAIGKFVHLFDKMFLKYSKKTAIFIDFEKKEKTVQTNNSK